MMSDTAARLAHTRTWNRQRDAAFDATYGRMIREDRQVLRAMTTVIYTLRRDATPTRVWSRTSMAKRYQMWMTVADEVFRRLNRRREFRMVYTESEFPAGTVEAP